MAFPINGILDTFNRVDVSSPPTGWSNIIGTGNWYVPSSAIITATHLVENVNGGGGGYGIYWNANKFGSDCESYLQTTVPPTTATLDCMVRLDVNAGNCYMVRYSTSGFSIKRYDNGSSTNLILKSLTMSANDSMGISAVGNLLTAYYKPSGGSWSSQLVYNISNDSIKYKSNGYIGIDLTSTDTTAVNNFGGGNLTFRMRETLTPNGTRIGSRQTVNSWL